MKLLMFSTDEHMLRFDTEAQRRIADLYGAAAERVYIVVFTRDVHGPREVRLAPNVVAYPTRNRWASAFFVAAYRIGANIIKKEGFVATDVVTAQDPFETGIVGCLLASRRRLPFIVQVHTDFLSPWFRRESLKNILRVVFARYALRHAARVRAVSPRIKHTIMERYGLGEKKICVLPVFVEINEGMRVDTVRLRERYPEAGAVLLMASRLSREKNITLALRAMREVLAVHPRTLLAVVGGGPEEQRLRVAARRFGIAEHVAFEPWSSDLGSYYRSSDVFLLASNYEGYGRTIVEALSHGLPVVMTDVGCAGWLVKDKENGRIVGVGDIRGFARAIIEILGDESLKRRYAAAAQKSAARLPGREAYRRAFTDLFAVSRV